MEEILNIPQAIVIKLQGLDSTTLNHSIRLQELARGYEQYDNHESNLLSVSALVHDIGKVYISTKILDKPAVLSDLEREIINLHPYYSYSILKSDDVDDRICKIALYHHGINPPMLNKETEKSLGDELTKAVFSDTIIEYSKILRTLDMYEALTSDRPYRRGFTEEEALNILLDDKHTYEPVINFIRDTIY